MMKARSTLWSRREARRIFAGSLTTLLLAFIALTVFVSRRPAPPRLVVHFDQQLRAYPGAPRYVVATWLRAAGSAPVVVGLAVVMAVVIGVVWHRRDLALVCIAAPVLAGATELAIKAVVERGTTHTAALEGAFGAGFPSGHTAGITAVAAAAVLSVLELTRESRAIVLAGGAAAILVSAVASSSIVGGAHRSLDVIGGILLGVAAVLAVFIAVSVQADAGSRSARSTQSAPQ
jgi:membrane-associated phospholipid phosphatase